MPTQLPHAAEANGVRRRRRPQPSMIVAIVALVAATGGTATALPGRHTVDRNDIAKNAIRSKAIKDGQVTGADVRDGGVTSADVADGTIAGGDIADGTIGRADLAPAGITGAEIADGTVAAGDLAKGSVGSEQIATRAVGSGQIAAGAVGGEQIAPGEAEDGIVFTLPPAYRPQHFDLSGLAHQILVAPDAGAEFSGIAIPGGAVYSLLDYNAALDGVSIRAASGAAAAAAEKPAEVSREGLARLAG